MNALTNDSLNIPKDATAYCPEASNVWGPIPSPPPNWTWEKLMDEALYEAQQAALNDEVPVGAVIVHASGTIVARSRNSPIKLSDPTAHAEILAIRSAGTRQGSYRLNDCILVVTLEPCLMCVGAVVHARLKGVVYGAIEKNTGAVASCVSGLDFGFHNHATWHLGGVKGKQCAEKLQAFFALQRAKQKKYSLRNIVSLT